MFSRLHTKSFVIYCEARTWVQRPILKMNFAKGVSWIFFFRRLDLFLKLNDDRIESSYVYQAVVLYIEWDFLFWLLLFFGPDLVLILINLAVLEVLKSCFVWKKLQTHLKIGKKREIINDFRRLLEFYQPLRHWLICQWSWLLI